MIAVLLFTLFIVLMLIGTPVGVALGIAGTVAIVMANMDTYWYGLMAVPQNFYAGLSKYPLLAIPMFVLLGSIFDRSGVAARLVNLAVAIVGRGFRHVAHDQYHGGHVPRGVFRVRALPVRQRWEPS